MPPSTQGVNGGEIPSARRSEAPEWRRVWAAATNPQSEKFLGIEFIGLI